MLPRAHAHWDPRHIRPFSDFPASTLVLTMKTWVAASMLVLIGLLLCHLQVSTALEGSGESYVRPLMTSVCKYCKMQIHYMFDFGYGNVIYEGMPIISNV